MVSTVKMFNLAIPRKEDLRCMVCNIVNPGNDPMIRYPDNCKNKLKYRKFLDKMPEAMAAPINFQNGIIYIIITKDLFESPTFLRDCYALDIKPVKQHHSISDSIYEMCLLNTIEHKLLEQWNKVGQYLVEGPDFLNSTGRVNAIELNIYIRDNNSASYAQLYMQAFNLQIPVLGLEDRVFQPNLVNVLPSLTRTFAMLRVEKAIQEEQLALCEYWKKIYGYTLPVNEEGLFVYNVELFQEPTKVYPEICLTSSQDLTPSLPANDVAGIYINFIRDLRERVTALCGQELVYPEMQEV